MECCSAGRVHPKVFLDACGLPYKIANRRNQHLVYLVHVASYLVHSVSTLDQEVESFFLTNAHIAQCLPMFILAPELRHDCAG